MATYTKKGTTDSTFVIFASYSFPSTELNPEETWNTWTKSVNLIDIHGTDNIIGNYKRIKKNGLSKNFLNSYQNELDEKYEYIEGFEKYYNQVVSRIIPVLINSEPLSLDLQITVSNTLYLTVNFDDKISLKLEAFIRNKEDSEDPISFAYSFFNGKERILARFEYFEKIEQTLDNDLSFILNKYSESVEDHLETQATIV